MGIAHAAARYVENSTDLSDEVTITSEGPKTVVLTGKRTKADGSPQEVRIEVYDNGPRAGRHRYHVDVYAEGVAPIRGNPDETIELALSNADAHRSGLG